MQFSAQELKRIKATVRRRAPKPFLSVYSKASAKLTDSVPSFILSNLLVKFLLDWGDPEGTGGVEAKGFFVANTADSVPWP